MSIIPNWHPFFVHFAITFVLVLGTAQLMAWFMPKTFSSLIPKPLHTLLVTVTVLAVLVTVGAGFVAYNTVNHDTPSHLAMTNHKLWAMATTSVVILGALLFFVLPKYQKWLAGTLFVLASVLVLITGFKGSELVYRHGLGVMSLPDTDNHDHSAHDHANDKHTSHDNHHKHDKENEHQVNETNRKIHGLHDHTDGHHKKPSKNDDNTHVHADGKVHQH